MRPLWQLLRLILGRTLLRETLYPVRRTDGARFLPCAPLLMSICHDASPALRKPNLYNLIFLFYAFHFPYGVTIRAISTRKTRSVATNHYYYFKISLAYYRLYLSSLYLIV